MQPLNIVIMSKFFFKYYNFSQIFKRVNFYLHCSLGKEKFQVALETQPTISINFVNQLNMSAFLKKSYIFLVILLHLIKSS